MSDDTKDIYVYNNVIHAEVLLMFVIPYLFIVGIMEKSLEQTLKNY